MLDDIFGMSEFPASEMNYEVKIGKYLLSVKLGKYYEFSDYILSNQEHYHDCYELVMVLGGKGTFMIDGDECTLGRGDLFLSDPYTTHEIHIPSASVMKIFYLFFTFGQVERITDRGHEEQIISQFLLRHKYIVVNQEHLLAYLSFVEHYAKRPALSRDYWIQKNMISLLMHSLEASLIITLHSSSFIRPDTATVLDKALDYIDQNIESDMKADDIAAVVGVSKRTLYDMFKRNLNQPVHRYIKERKTELAKQYLKMGMSVTDASSMVGIESASYFSQIFKKYNGITPRDYMKKHPVDASGYTRRHLRP